MSPEEDKIWQSIRQKDGQAFERYYKEHYKFFLLAAVRYLEDTTLAQEIVNDIFVRLWQDGDRIEIESSLKAYIYRAVVNRSLNELGKGKKARLLRQELSRRPEGVAGWTDLEDDELKVRLYQAIDQLPEQCGKVFRMSRFEEMKQQEIADRLGISIKTVKNHITHALQQLNRVLDEWNALPFWIILIKYSFFWHLH